MKNLRKKDYYDSRQRQEYVCLLANKVLTLSEVLFTGALNIEEKEALLKNKHEIPAAIMQNFPGLSIVKKMPAPVALLLKTLEDLHEDFDDREFEWINGMLVVSKEDIEQHNKSILEAGF